MISSCALYIHEILIYNTLIGTQQGSLAQTDQSGGWLFLLPGLDAHLCTFDTKQSNLGDDYPPGFC